MTIFPELESYLKKQLAEGIQKSALASIAYFQTKRQFQILHSPKFFKGDRRLPQERNRSFEQGGYEGNHNEEGEGGGKQTKRKKKKENKLLDENKKIKIETGMQFYAVPKQQ